jgi:hypothetical protein
MSKSEVKKILNSFLGPGGCMIPFPILNDAIEFLKKTCLYRTYVK